jgi:hypothetical protein
MVKVRQSIFILYLIVLLILIALISLIYRKYETEVKDNDHLKYEIIKLKEEYNNELNKPKAKNAILPIELNVKYGNGQGTHPKVLYFKKGFNGYKFYMAYTPYYKANDNYENPTIAVSNDGIEWKEIEGLKNPIDEPDNFKSGVNYNSDTHLVYNEYKNEIECWWRYVEGDKVIIYRKVTIDGINYSDKEKVLEANRNEVDFLSPTIIYEDGKYKMWFIDVDRTLKYTETSDFKNWSEYKKLETNYNDSSLNNWHLDIIKDVDDYKLVMSAYYNGHNHIRMNLYYSSSKDGLEWNDF